MGGKSVTNAIGKGGGAGIKTFLGNEMATHVHEITNVPVSYMALGLNDFDWG
jgi:hypothetical protein